MLCWLLSLQRRPLFSAQSLRGHQLAQLAKCGELIDSIVSWNLEYLATVKHLKGAQLSERQKALFARQPMLAFNPSVLMTLSSDDTFVDRFWSQYSAIAEAHMRCSLALGAIDYPDVDATELDKAVTEFAKLSSMFYSDILRKIYD
jgi:hypothetical protein